MDERVITIGKDGRREGGGRRKRKGGRRSIRDNCNMKIYCEDVKVVLWRGWGEKI